MNNTSLKKEIEKVVKDRMRRFIGIHLLVGGLCLRMKASVEDGLIPYVSTMPMVNVAINGVSAKVSFIYDNHEFEFDSRDLLEISN